MSESGSGKSNGVDAVSREIAARSLKKGFYALAILQITMIILFASCAEIKKMDGLPGNISQGYAHYIGVEIMM